MALTGSCSGDPFSVHGHKDSCLVSHPGPEYGFPVNQVILSCNFYIFIASPYQPDLSAPKLFHNHTIVCDTCLITGGNQFPESLKDLIVESAAPYFIDQRSVEDVVKQIQSRAFLYVNEQR